VHSIDKDPRRTSLAITREIQAFHAPPRQNEEETQVFIYFDDVPALKSF
jgi:hypothetical protein